MADNRNTIIEKYHQNIRGVFKELLKMAREAREKNHRVISDELILAGRDFLMNREPVDSLIHIAFRGTAIIDHVINKDVKYFQESWTSLIAGQDNIIVKKVLSTQFDITDKNDNVIYNRECIDKIFIYVHCVYKLALKMVLDASGIRKKISNGNYILKSQVHDYFDSKTLSHLLTHYNVTGIP